MASAAKQLPAATLALRDAAAIGDARNQLSTVLSFFPRVDAKQTAILGILVAMLGYLAAKWPASLSAIPIIQWISGGLFFGLAAACFFTLYRGSFPNLDGGEGSLVFFRAIAGRREVDFSERYAAMSDADLAKDLLCQVWRNSVILHDKFKWLRWSYRLLLASVGPWLLALVLCR